MAKIDWQFTEGTVSNIMEVGPYGKGSTVYAITFIYKVDGHFYGGEFNDVTGHGFSEGGTIRIGYNPANPEENDRNRKGGWMRWAYVGSLTAGVAMYFLIHGCHK